MPLIPEWSFERLCQEAVKEYGVDAQLDMVIEELTELSLAVQHYKRAKNHTREDSKSFSYLGKVFEEIADVELMIGQMENMTKEESKTQSPREAIVFFKRQKMLRQEQRIKKRRLKREYELPTCRSCGKDNFTRLDSLTASCDKCGTIIYLVKKQGGDKSGS